jgi:hypothetical protein
MIHSQIPRIYPGYLWRGQAGLLDGRYDVVSRVAIHAFLHFGYLVGVVSHRLLFSYSQLT